MSVVLPPNVSDRAFQIANPQRTKIVAGRPFQLRTRHHSIPIRDSRTRALQPLNETRDIGLRRQFQDEMYVVAHDPDPEKFRGVPAGNLREHASQKLRSPGGDDW